MSFFSFRRLPLKSDQISRNGSKIKQRFNMNISLKTIACAVILTASSSVFADAHFGVGLSDRDKKVTWLENDVSVSDDITTQTDDRWNAKEEDFSILDDYQGYLKSFTLYMVFKRNF